jgi:hypothetical protein
MELLSGVALEGVAKKYECEIGEGRTADFVVLHDRVNVYLKSSEMPVAVLRFGGPSSGALWMGGDLIGEFRREPGGALMVVEIEDGFKKPTPIEDTDPIAYLLARL